MGSVSSPTKRRLSSDWIVLLTSLVIHVALVLYAHHVDTHPERFGGLKYTDVDWRVVTDGAKLIFNGGKDESTRAQGWIVGALDLNVGDPYQRQTFRYTPLLPLVLSPTLIHPLLGKLTLSILSLLVPVVLLSQPRPPRRTLVHALWTLNPLVINITTRGSPEAIVLLLVVGTLAALKRSDLSRDGNNTSQEQRTKWETVAALVYAASVSWKIYPIIYAPAIWAHLARTHGWLGWGVWRFGLFTLLGLLCINLPLWAIWGQPFLDQTFLYHLSRQDHRHNFSAYYYPIYLSFFASSTPTRASGLDTILYYVQQIPRNPLASFVPQAGLVTLVGLYLTPRTSLDFALLLQTAIFVVFNKVCTSQYFTWFIPLLPGIIPHLHLSSTQTIILVSAWVGAQALWLGTAYQLEFLARSVHLQLWACGVALFGVSVWIIGRLIDAWDDRAEGPRKTGTRGSIPGDTKSRGTRRLP